jgi:cysteine-rich repeat protein
MKTWLMLGLSGCLFSCQLIFRPDPLLFLENTEAHCFDGVDNDDANGTDCADPSCSEFCNVEPPNEDFSISALTSNNCTIITNETITGDDRGVIIAGGGDVFYSGDISMAAFRGDGLNPQAFGVIYDAVFSDISSGKIYTFLDVTGAPILGPSGDATSFQEIDPQNGALLGTPTLLSQSIKMIDAGFFSGAGLAVVVDSANNAFLINITGGRVDSLGLLSSFNHQGCENKAFGGIVESVNDQLSLVYVANEHNIIRKNLTDATVPEQVVASFAMLNDMCSLSVSPSLNRWYFHSEGFTSLTPLTEHVGFCDALFGAVTSPVCGDGIFQSPEECDDGNSANGDGCSGCKLDTCGDNILNNVVQGNPLEACDDGNNSSQDGCRSDCEGTEVCGDGLLDTGEECDDGNSNNGDGCEFDCKFACGGALFPKVAYFNQSTGHCYAVLNAIGTWTDMQQACINVGGDLASISDLNENNTVLPGAAIFQAWLGFTDANQEGSFIWSDGSPSSFTNFAAGEPNDQNGGEDCVNMTEAGLWNDLSCAEFHKPLCEIP